MRISGKDRAPQGEAARSLSATAFHGIGLWHFWRTGAKGLAHAFSSLEKEESNKMF
jgi:hypothetical protein